MSPTDDEHTRQFGRAAGTVEATGDSPEATIIERVRPPVAPDLSNDRTERDVWAGATTARMEPVSGWPAHRPADLAAPAPPALDRRVAAEAPRPAAPRSARLPGWVLPYLIGCITLLLAGAFVLWTQARVLGHF
ncbi:MAG TPA: hypothetical protein VLT33_04385 [Labilithrix sp.]|nr:hypothetical protein [Labilithrix sp.]